MKHLANAQIPMAAVGPVKIISKEITDEVMVPLATFETPLWPSTNRGAKVSRLAGGIKAVVVRDCMTRSIVLEAKSITDASLILGDLEQRVDEMRHIVSQTSKFAKFMEFHSQIVGNLMYLRFAIQSGDASGHNMVTAAAEGLLNWILNQYSELKYVSISANMCTDKKVSAVNGLLGRGKYVVAELEVDRKICSEVLKTTPEKIVNLHIKKNLIGTSLAGGLRSANAHFANMLLALYLATGQDAANIIEGSQGMVHAEIRHDKLYFSVTLPNIIVGSVGNGKNLPFAEENLKLLHCNKSAHPGENARRLSIITAACVLCGEISLLAAQTNPGELMRTHVSMERQNNMEDITENV